MDKNNDFFQLFKVLEAQHTPISRKVSDEKRQEAFLMLSHDTETGETTLHVVNKKLKPITVSADQHDGAMASILRAMERAGGGIDFGWGDNADSQQLILSEHPELLYLLRHCADHVVDSQGRTITFTDEVRQPMLRIETSEQDGEKHFLTSLYLISESGETTFTPLTDAFILTAQQEVCPVASLGENYRQLSHFAGCHLTADVLEHFLSLFFSYTSHVGLDYERHRVVDRGEVVECVPTLCFERVDADRALYLRVMDTLPTDDAFAEAASALGVGTVASIGLDRTITLKHVVRHPLEESIALLSKILGEYAPSRQARKDIYQEDDFFIVPEESAGPFLFGALPQLLRHFTLVGADRLRDYKVSPAQPRLNVNLTSGIDFLEGDANVQIGDDTFTLQDLLKTWRKQHYVVLSDGNRAIIADDYMRRLERIFDTSKRKDGHIRISFFDLPEVEDLLQDRLEGEVFERHRKVYRGFNELAAQRLPKPKVKAKLRDYQQEGVKWIKYLYDNRLGGCLADDMGLGKTLQTITILAAIYPKVKKPSLIVMPRSLIFNWESELTKFAPQLKVYTYYGTDRNLDEALKAQVILTTYAVTRNDIEVLHDKRFHYVILDESQNIKNVTSQATQAVHLLQAEHRLALSGTPVENNLTELYSLFRFLNPAMFGSLDAFNQRYTYPIQKNGDKMVLDSLRRKIYPFLLRRLKKDVLSELPDRIDQTLRVEMTDEQRRLYDERRRYYKALIDTGIKQEGIQKAQFVMFQALNELRQIASIPEAFSDGKIASPKTAQLLDSLTEAVENGHKVVVFFNFLLGIELVADHLQRQGIGYVEMTGATTNRQKVVDTFQQSPDCMVMLMTLKTGGVGLNLTAADTVFIFEPWWNKAAEEQAINRLHRIGQQQKVLSYSIIAEGTIEEKILLLQQQKAELFEGLIGSDTSSSKVLTEEDINFILG